MNRIFLTVDTECHDLQKENQYIWGKRHGKEYGLHYILEKGKRYGIPINFFVDFAEENRYGHNFIERIISTIKEYDQPIFLHLHPNYISGDDNRTYFWEYSREQQKEMLQTGIDIYKDHLGEKPIAFRAGRYGADANTYDLLNELLPGVIDFSYIGRDGKMCHVEDKMVHTINHFVRYKSIGVMPNCNFIALDLFGTQKRVAVDASEISLTEFQEFIAVADGRDFVLTMHSWNFIESFFGRRICMGRHRVNDALFNGIIRIAKEKGYHFARIDESSFCKDNSVADINYNSCNSTWKKVRAIGLNFWRFQQMAKISRKYFILYTFFYFALLIGLVALIKCMIR